MRIIAGTWRGRVLASPPGQATRPTAERVRQALFDMLVHAPWGGRLEELAVLDAFAGTGALGLEALSRGAAHATFLERDRAALAVLRANLDACGAGARARAHPGDVLRPPAGAPCALVFLDPPYGEGLVPRAVAALRAAGWIAPGALLVGELGAAEGVPALDGAEQVAERRHGAALLAVWRMAGSVTPPGVAP